jgi:CHRD domain-containing protein
MRVGRQSAMWSIGVVVTAMIFAAGCSQMSSRMGSTSDSMPTLSGGEEVPPVNSQASGISRIAVIGDKTVTGSVEVRNLDATAAHIHLAPKGQNGPVIIPLVKTGENVWSVPPSTMLSSAQFDAYRSGNLYVNVHSAANPNGEIRAQLKP